MTGPLDPDTGDPRDTSIDHVREQRNRQLQQALDLGLTSRCAACYLDLSWMLDDDGQAYAANPDGSRHSDSCKALDRLHGAARRPRRRPQ